MTTLTEWAQTAAPGARLIYGRDDGMHRPATNVMREARDLREAGIVHTLLRREKDGRLAYIAQRTGGKGGPMVDGGFPPEAVSAADMRRARILSLMEEGRTNLEIAHALGTTYQSVSQAIHIMRKNAGRHIPERGWMATRRAAE